jgi:hypothetical protein
VSSAASGLGGQLFTDCQTAGQKEPCYEGDPKQGGVGACVMGARTCEENGEFFVWSECQGSGVPAKEICGDQLDSDCDGDNDNGCVGCDMESPIWSDPYKDGSLRLKKSQTAALAAGIHEHSFICSQDMGRVNVCADTEIKLTSETPTVIGGNGIGPLGNTSPNIKVIAALFNDIWILVDATYGPVTIIFDAPNANVTLT